MYSITIFALFCVFVAPLLFILSLIWMGTRGRQQRNKNDVPAAALEDLKKRADQYKERIEILESLLLEQDKQRRHPSS
jgi:hypothetical protein